MRNTEYKTVEVSTLEGLKKAERLVARGWKIYRSGLFYVYLVKRHER